MTDLSEEYPEARESRTARYRKVTKPLLERRRRARINRCLEELKDLMVGALEVERENINKLEKADILELTVRHLSKLRGPKDSKVEAEKFQAGFGHCAAEAYHFILSTPGVDQNIIQQLVKHLSTQLNEKPINPIQPPIVSPAPSTSSVSSGHSAPSPNYPLDYQRSSPSVSPREDHSRYQQSWKEDTPSIPVEKTLTCDVSSYNNTHPAARRLGEPGLLMTVNDARKMSTHLTDNQSNQPNMQPMYSANEYSERRVGYSEPKERPVDQNAERKNVILKKIREHIMERQHREPDSTTSTKRDNKNQRDNKMKTSRTSSEHADTSYAQRSKNFVPYPENRQDDGRLYQDVREEAVNLTHDSKKNERSGNNYDTSCEEMRLVTSTQEIKATKRRQTDYKSIHHKKVFIRTPNMSSVNERSDGLKGDVFNQRRNESPGYCVDKKDNSYYEMNRHAEENLRAPIGTNNENSNLAREGFQRYKNHFFNLEKEEYYRDPNLDQDDMWRPW